MTSAYAPLIAAMPMPALLVDRSERILSHNALAAAIFGHDGTGRHYITVLRQPAVLDIIEQTLRDGTTRTARYLGAEGGRDTTWKVTSSPVTLPEGRLTLVCFEDTTAVDQAGQMRRDFIANLSHELRTPLTALLGFVETLRGPAREDPVARDRFLGIMQREAGRMARLVDELLSLSRVEAEERVRPVTPVDLGALVDGVIASLAPMAEAARLALAVQIPSSSVTVPGDANQLRQVVLNLVENAIKYGGTERDVRITLTAPAHEPILRGQGVRLTVTDAGEGIAGHHIPRLTERFYRVDSHRSREIGGTGLGLAIVKHIVNRHRGRLRIDSRLGEGSTFTVILPAD